MAYMMKTYGKKNDSPSNPPEFSVFFATASCFLPRFSPQLGHLVLSGLHFKEVGHASLHDKENMVKLLILSFAQKPFVVTAYGYGQYLYWTHYFC